MHSVVCARCYVRQEGREHMYQTIKYTKHLGTLLQCHVNVLNVRYKQARVPLLAHCIGKAGSDPDP
jgi:hypothetical protein